MIFKRKTPIVLSVKEAKRFLENKKKTEKKVKKHLKKFV